MSATINDVAKAAGVSKATISRYLNDKDRVNVQTSQRIEEVIGRLNYIPNATARNLVLKQTDKIGVLLSGVNSLFWNGILECVHNYMSQLPESYEIFSLNCDSMVLYNTNKSIRDKIQVLAEQRVAGIILAIRDLHCTEVDYLCEMDIPFVVIQSNCEDERVSYVNIDNYAASFMAAQHLIQLGHKSIAYVSGPTDAVFATERFKGFRDALMAKKLYRRTNILNGDNTFDDGYWRMKQILSWKPLPTAVMLASDAMAYGAMDAIREAGLSIPRDISIIGFDGLRAENDVFKLLPPLTTVHQPMREIGEKTAEMMIKKIKEKAAGKSRVHKVMLPTEFIDNGSTRELDER